MDGVAIIRALLVANGDVVAVSPAARIVAGTLPLGTVLPALSITRVSQNEMRMVKRGTKQHVTERVQVTVLAGNYPTLRDLLRKIRKIPQGVIGNQSGLTDVTVHVDGAGPDMMDTEANIHMGSQDFLVGYTEAL